VIHFTRSDSHVETLSRWGNGWAGHDRRTGHAVDLKALTCEPAKVPGLDLVFDVAGEDRRHALGQADGRIALLREEGDGWRPLELPRDLWTSYTAISLGVSGDQRVISQWRSDAPARFFVSQGTRWRTFDAPAWATRMRSALHFAFHRGRWLLGLSNGEFGGGLLSLGPDGLTAFDDIGQNPVNAIVCDRDRAYVATGMSHMGMRQGELWCLEPGTAPELITSTEVKRVMFEWPGEKDAMMGCALDSQRRLHLLLDERGVVRLDGDQFVPLTPEFPPYAATSLELLDDAHALICHWRFGVLAWKLGTEDVKQITVPARRK
jgi:hypothetical protein